MKRTLFIFTLLVCALHASTQTLNNEWIDYSKTYFKFKVGKTGIYRISQSDLNSIGLAATPAEDFQLWRNGKEVEIFSSVPAGTMGTNDYLQFWGEENDGKADKPLYKNASWQLSDRFSLETDTAAYFLTVNKGTNLRYKNVANNLTGNTLLPIPYFMHTLRHDFKNQIHKGRALNYGVYVYSSAYEIGEGWSSNDISPAAGYTETLSAALAIDKTGPVGTLSVGLAGNSFNGTSRKIDVSVNGTQVLNPTLNSLDARTYNTSIPATLIPVDAINFQLNYQSDPADRIVISFVEYKYPRKFDFGNEKQFAFTLPASSSKSFLQISNFNGGNSPVLYDITKRERYTAVLQNGTYQVLVSPSTVERKFILLNEDPVNVMGVGTFSKTIFTDFSNPLNQGGFIFISGKKLLGTSALKDYASYRASSAGGGFTTIVVDADELCDQFAFGIKKHPLGVKNFLQYARQKFSSPPRFCFLVGKGMTYDENRKNESNVLINDLNQVPTYGYPASDVLLAAEAFEPVAATPIGRISVINETELQNYLNKIKAYEQQQANSVQTLNNKMWMKNVVFVQGLNSGAGLEPTIDGYFDGYQKKIEDSLFGAKVSYFANKTTGPITPVVNKKMQDLFSEGISLFNYFGHSSAINLDYTIDDPAVLKNQGKYPMFLLNGCDAGNIFSFDPDRLSHITSIAEKFVLTPNAGAIGFIGSSHYGVTTYLDIFNAGFYNSLRSTGYGSPVSYNLIDAEKALLNSSSDVSTKYLQAEEHILNGDPAIKINAHSKPDYMIEEKDVRFEPAILTVAETKFKLKLDLHNIGRYSGDSLGLNVKQQLPDGAIVNVFNQKIATFGHTDSLEITIPLNGAIAAGENKMFVVLDEDQFISELSETNNSVAKTFYITAADARPIYPYDLSIVPNAIHVFYASTADPFLPSKEYFMELDTTLQFNSPVKYQTSIQSKGGLLEFQYPGILSESVAYYWRVGREENGTKTWRNASFIFLKDKKGFNQSHFYQHLQSGNVGMTVSNQTGWQFSTKANTIRARLAVLGASSGFQSEFSVMYNGSYLTKFYCLGRSVIVNILNPNNLLPMYNQASPSFVNNGAEGGFMGSAASCDPSRNTNFEFSVVDAASRAKLRDFLEWIPSGYYVILRNINSASLPNSYVDDWKADISVYGAGNTLYDKLKQAGFGSIDKYTSNRVWSFIYKKSDPSFQTAEVFSDGVADKAFLEKELSSYDSVGTLESPKIGPAKKWNVLLSAGTASAYTKANTQLEIIGIDPSGGESLLMTTTPEKDTDLSGITTSSYPFLKLRLRTKNGESYLPYQLQHWRILYEGVPEGALHPILKFEWKDTADIGEPVKLGIPFKNISTESFDSIAVRLEITDKNNSVKTISLPKTKKLASGDTAWVNTAIETKELSGNNLIHLNVNPGQQPEQSYSNNFFTKKLFVRSDVVNPLLSVTFDGVRILNNEIVSSHPNIQIELKDDAKYLLLSDTSLVNVQLTYPNGNVRQFYYSNTDTLKFTPATAGSNTAYINFLPALEDDGDYQLTLRARDQSGNFVSANDYIVSFRVINKSMISDMFNYPNPFTTSTAFVFTITGDQVPQNLRIQILTITGKVVKEITKEELGPLHIGKNITEYKWNGTDEYGQKLANGVYLYRVITNLNGKSLDRFELKNARGDVHDTQKFFNRGYGKMYLMR